MKTSLNKDADKIGSFKHSFLPSGPFEAPQRKSIPGLAILSGELQLSGIVRNGKEEKKEGAKTLSHHKVQSSW